MCTNILKSTEQGQRMLLENQTITAPSTFPVKAYSVSYFRFDTEQIGEARL
jgi:hypothetical protein